MNDDILLAAYHGDLDILKKCISAKCDVNVKDDTGYTPLHWVSFMSDVGENRAEMARLLIDAGADVNSVLPNEGPSILSSACLAGSYEITKLLIENGADVNYLGNGETPLLHAIQSGAIEIVSYLLENGCDFNKPDALGQTPIEVAESYERQDIVDLLNQFANKN